MSNKKLTPGQIKAIKEKAKIKTNAAASGKIIKK